MNILYALGWIACGVLHYGLWVGYFQTKYSLIADDDWLSDRIWGVGLAFLGPIALQATLFLHIGSDAFRWRW